jgi:SHS2 domain-containing protein
VTWEAKPSPQTPAYFEVLEHTADAGIVGHGRTLAEAFEQVALGMYSLMVDLDDVEEVEARDIRVSGDTQERVLTNWLSELLFLTDTAGLVFRRFDVELADGRLSGRAYGEQVDPERHRLSGAVKGVTRHLLEVAPEDGGYRARVIFDL